MSDITVVIDALLAAVGRELEQPAALSASGESETDWIELTPDSRDRLAAFQRRVLVLKEDWQYVKHDLLASSAPATNPEYEIERHFAENRPLLILFHELRRVVSQSCPGVTCYANTKWICSKRERNFLIVERTATSS